MEVYFKFWSAYEVYKESVHLVGCAVFSCFLIYTYWKQLFRFVTRYLLPVSPSYLERELPLWSIS